MMGVNVGIWEWDFVSDILIINVVWVLMFGYIKDELVF